MWDDPGMGEVRRREMRAGGLRFLLLFATVAVAASSALWAYFGIANAWIFFGLAAAVWASLGVSAFLFTTWFGQSASSGTSGGIGAVVIWLVARIFVGIVCLALGLQGICSYQSALIMLTISLGIVDTTLFFVGL